MIIDILIFLRQMVEYCHVALMLIVLSTIPTLFSNMAKSLMQKNNVHNFIHEKLYSIRQLTLVNRHDVILLHDNTQPHVSTTIVVKLNQSQYKTLFSFTFIALFIKLSLL